MQALTDDTKAILLLCGVLDRKSTLSPLSQREYALLAQWLYIHDMRPASLLKPEHITKAADGSRIARDRLEALMNRGVQLGFVVENWQRSGIWIISRSDPEYPSRYKQHLKDKAPPLLFGVGDRSLLQGGGLGIVGSRNVDDTGQQFTKRVGEYCAFEKIPVVSGGARGVDQIAMGAVLEAGGVCIGVIAENLLRKSVARDARMAIHDGRLLLISPYHPEARFTVGTAMGRNKLIYAMAEYGLVVSAEYNKGGTWTGAKEELKRENSRPVFVRISKDTPEGNRKLLDLGAIQWPVYKTGENLQAILQKAVNDFSTSPQKSVEPDLFNYQAPTLGQQKTTVTQSNSCPQEKHNGKAKGEENKPIPTIYQVVLPIILDNMKAPTAIDDLAGKTNVKKGQLNEWLKLAIKEKRVKKLTKPVRYIRADS